MIRTVLVPVVLTVPGEVYLLRESGVMKLGPFQFPKAVVVVRLRLSIHLARQPALAH